MASLVSARGFGWRHAGRKRAALSDISFDIQAGEKVLLLGPSGAGKSTLLAAIAGVLGDDSDGVASGQLLIDGESAAHTRGTVGLVLQDPESQVISARVGDDVAFGAENLGVPREEIWTRVRRALDTVGLDVPLDYPTTRLSGGQKQRLALAGVLAMGARVICLDEPTANIDPDSVPQLRDAAISAAAATGATLIVVEHRVDAWVNDVDRIIVLSENGIVADASPETVLRIHGEMLQEAGVWVPGAPPLLPDAQPVTQINPIISASQLSVGYGSHRRGWFGRLRSSGRHAQQDYHLDNFEGTVIARDLDLSIPREASTCLIGANGTGKSTVALTLGGLLEPAGGQIAASKSLRLVDGNMPKSGAGPYNWKSTELATRIGSVFQSPEHQFVTATVQEELELGPKLVGINAADRVSELMERLCLGHLAQVNPFSLSGGEKRRLSVATVLTTAPSLLILDEPTFGQDRSTFAELLYLLRELIDEQGTSVVSVTHDPLVVAAMGDFIIDLDERQNLGTVGEDEIGWGTDTGGGEK